MICRLFTWSAVTLFAIIPFSYAHADDFPPGIYKNNSKPTPFGGGCEPKKMGDGTLYASCDDFYGAKHDSSLPNAAQCVSDKHQIENINGNLRCVVSSKKIDGSHPYTGDIVSIISNIKTKHCLGNCPPDQQTIIVRVDQPNVIAPMDIYTNMVFHQGDTVSLDGGGCVHTASGWKSYVHSTDTGGQQGNTVADFSGTVQITGATADLEPLSGLIHKTLTVPIPTNPSLPQLDLDLVLGYNATDYNNGYWHDGNSTDNCKDGPAWVQITVNRQLRYIPDNVSWSPHSKPFDVVWDVNNEDYNGLPLNPMWGSQLDLPDSTPDFKSICGSAFMYPPPGGHVSTPILNVPIFDMNKLARTCTSQTTTLDLDTSALEDFGYCNDSTTVMPGHLTWTTVTYTGDIDWEGWSGDPNAIDNFDLADGDYNLSLYSYGSGQYKSTSIGLTTQEYAVGLEFQDSETIYRAGSPFWNQMKMMADFPIQNAGPLFNENMWSLETGPWTQPYLPGVVTGIIGIDGVHGAYAEVHPVFALALNTATSVLSNSVLQTWVFFLHTRANGGGCSED